MQEVPEMIRYEIEPVTLDGSGGIVAIRFSLEFIRTSVPTVKRAFPPCNKTEREHFLGPRSVTKGSWFMMTHVCKLTLDVALWHGFALCHLE